MNGKQAKRLRRFATAYTNYMNSQNEQTESNYVVHTIHDREVTTFPPIFEFDSDKVRFVKVVKGLPLRWNPNSLRGRYKTMKNFYRVWKSGRGIEKEIAKMLNDLLKNRNLLAFE